MCHREATATAPVLDSTTIRIGGRNQKTPEAILWLMQPDQEIINRWTGSAPYWEKHREIIRQMFAPVTQGLVEDGQIGSGQVVLDIAMGPGEPALSVAGLVGPKAKYLESIPFRKWRRPLAGGGSLS